VGGRLQQKKGIIKKTGIDKTNINKTFTTWGLETIADIKNGCGYLSAALP